MTNPDRTFALHPPHTPTRTDRPGGEPTGPDPAMTRRKDFPWENRRGEIAGEGRTVHPPRLSVRGRPRSIVIVPPWDDQSSSDGVPHPPGRTCNAGPILQGRFYPAMQAILSCRLLTFPGGCGTLARCGDVHTSLRSCSIPHLARGETRFARFPLGTPFRSFALILHCRLVIRR